MKNLLLCGSLLLCTTGPTFLQSTPAVTPAINPFLNVNTGPRQSDVDINELERQRLELERRRVELETQFEINAAQERLDMLRAQRERQRALELERLALEQESINVEREWNYSEEDNQAEIDHLHTSLNQEISRAEHEFEAARSRRERELLAAIELRELQLESEGADGSALQLEILDLSNALESELADQENAHHVQRSELEQSLETILRDHRAAELSRRNEFEQKLDQIRQRRTELDWSIDDSRELFETELELRELKQRAELDAQHHALDLECMRLDQMIDAASLRRTNLRHSPGEVSLLRANSQEPVGTSLDATSNSLLHQQPSSLEDVLDRISALERDVKALRNDVDTLMDQQAAKPSTSRSDTNDQNAAVDGSPWQHEYATRLNSYSASVSAGRRPRSVEQQRAQEQ